jgi:hypothetical protein
MSKEFSFHTTNSEYPQFVYHDNIECPEGNKIKLGHRKPGTDDRQLCQDCLKLAESREQSYTMKITDTWQGIDMNGTENLANEANNLSNHSYVPLS